MQRNAIDTKRGRRQQVTVIGGAIAGLVAAIECSERGAEVQLFEATGKLGGRARSLERDGFTTNQGPHAIYSGGEAWTWLQERDLLPPLVTLDPTTIQMRYDGKAHRLPLRFLRAVRALRRSAPRDVSFDEWARTVASDAAARAAIGFLTLPTYDGAPGRHSAASMQEVLRRTTAPGGVHYIVGGWNRLVADLAERARTLGVKVELGARTQSLPSGNVIVATAPRAASELLGDQALRGDGQQVALRDIGLRSPGEGRRGPGAVFDLDDGAYVARYSSVDATLAPEGHDLLQCCSGVRPGEEPSMAHARIEAVLDAAYSDWRERIIVDRSSVTRSPGWRDPVGADWQDRPAINRGDGLYLAGDWVAAPGVLAEVSYSSAVAAAAAATATSARGRQDDVPSRV